MYGVSLTGWNGVTTLGCCTRLGWTCAVTIAVTSAASVKSPAP